MQELGLAQPESVTVRMTANGALGFAASSASPTEECVFYSGRVPRPRDDARANELVCRSRRSP